LRQYHKGLLARVNANVFVESALIVKAALTGLALILLIHIVLRGSDKNSIQLEQGYLLGREHRVGLRVQNKELRRILGETKYHLEMADELLVVVRKDLGAVRALEGFGALELAVALKVVQERDLSH
jgi:hypothetical protein